MYLGCWSLGFAILLAQAYWPVITFTNNSHHEQENLITLKKASGSETLSLQKSHSWKIMIYKPPPELWYKQHSLIFNVCIKMWTLLLFWNTFPKWNYRFATDCLGIQIITGVIKQKTIASYLWESSFCDRSESDTESWIIPVYHSRTQPTVVLKHCC
jgi:hypothetical protein